MRAPKRRRGRRHLKALPTQTTGAMVVVGICWIREDQYKRFLVCADDRKKLEDTWAERKISAERLIRQLRAMGQDVRKVEIDLDDLLAYCRAQGRPNTAATRAAYVAKLMRRQERGPA